MNSNKSPDQNPFSEAGQQLQELAQGPARQAAEQLEKMFARAGNSIGKELEKAARTGSISFSKMAESILRDLARIAVKQVVGGALSSILGQAVSGGFSGARAEGGPVLSGGAYLVGERGPEVFRPSSSGTVETQNTGTPITVNFNLGTGVDVTEFKRSSGQISAMLRRAVEQGRRSI